MDKNLEQSATHPGLKRIVFFGPESTGKSTMAESLSLYYNTKMVPEYMREYLQEKWDDKKETCTREDIVAIAQGQVQSENKLALEANKILFCDTDLLQLKVYSQEYFDGYCNPLIEKFAMENQYDLYFLLNIDTPWIADDLRDKPNDRERMFKRFHNELIIQNKKFIVLKGDLTQRLKKATETIDQLLN